jgi:hypothetical protein
VSTSGDDSYHGQSPSRPWKTIAKVNGYGGLRTGDKVLFKRGDTWTLASASDRLVGHSGITYADYGSGNLPIIDGAGLSDCFIAQNKGNIRLHNLDLRRGYDAGAQFIGCNDVTIQNCNMQGSGNDNLIFITNNRNVVITGGTYHDPVRRATGTMITNIEIADGGTNFLIDGIDTYGAENADISIHNHSSADPQGSTNIPTNVVIKHSYVHDSLGYGIQVLAQGVSAPPVVSIQDCVLISANTGIRVYKSASSPYYPQGVTISGCKIKESTTYGIFIQGDDCEIKRCVLWGTISTYLIRIDSAKRINVYNNTLHLSPAAANWPIYILGGARVDTINIKNNIIYMNTTSGQMIGTAALSGTNVTINYNWYFFKSYTTQARWMWLGTAYTYANWKTNSGQDANSSPNPSSDPNFTSVAGEDFTLQAGSPAIDKGVVIPGVTDGYLGAAPDCGAYEKA